MNNTIRSPMRQSSLKRTGNQTLSGSVGLGYNRILEFTQSHLRDKKVINTGDIDLIQEKIDSAITNVNQGIMTNRSGTHRNSPNVVQQTNKDLYYAVSPPPNKKLFAKKGGASTTARESSIDIAKYANAHIMTPN